MGRILLNIVLLFICMTLWSQTNTVSYSYWFDDNYSGVTSIPIVPTTSAHLSTNIDASSLNDGLHFIHLRFQDENASSSQVISRFFYKQQSTTSMSNEIEAYQFWFDNDFANASTINIGGASDLSVNTFLNGSTLNNGLHVLHIRFKDQQGQWSEVESRFFIKQPISGTPSSQLVRYEFWFNDNHGASQVGTIAGSTDFSLVSAINAQSLSEGLHQFHIRFQDSHGQWSSISSRFFYKQSIVGPASPSLVAYEYWFDSDYVNAENVLLGGAQNELLINDIDASMIADGLHVFNIRFLDERNQWSVIQSNFFFKSATSNNVVNEVDAYRYWFDQDFSSHSMEIFSTPVQDLMLSTDLDLTQIPHGVHEIHFQFRDITGKWSKIHTDTVDKYSLPVANFNADTNMICVGDEVTFFNASIDGDQHIWDFGDNSSSSDSAAMHVYNTPGVYDVTLTVKDTLTLQDSTIVLANYITVGDLASPDLVPNGIQEFCEGDELTISASTGFDYLWNTSETSSSITVDTSGAYYVQIMDQVNPACITESDTVLVNVLPLPMVDLGGDTSMCENEVMVLDAGNNGSDFLWNDGTDQQTNTVSSNGEYSVAVTDQNGCINSDTVYITVHPLPVVDLGPDISQENPPVTLDAGAGFINYNWSNTQTSQTIEVTTNGTYWVEVTDANMCSNADTIQVSFYAGLGDEQSLNVRVYPVPTSDYLTIAFEKSVGQMNYTIIDEMGRTVQSGLLSGVVNKLDVTSLSPGKYYITIDNGLTHRRIPMLVK